MSVRPGGRDDDDGPETVEFGIAALAARLDDAEVQYPADADDLVHELGDPEIPTDVHGNALALSTAVENAPRDRFDSDQDVMNALHPIFEAHRTSTPSGILGSIRSILPF